MADLEAIYRDYSEKVYGYFLHKVCNQTVAEDLCSDVFLKITANIDRYDSEKASVSTWIYQISRNTLYDYFRTHREFGELDEMLPGDEDFVEDLCTDEMLETLADALEILDEREKEIVVRHYGNEESLKDIAARLEISYSYAKLLHQNALQKMKRFFEK